MARNCMASLLVDKAKLVICQRDEDVDPYMTGDDCKPIESRELRPLVSRAMRCMQAVC